IPVPAPILGPPPVTGAETAYPYLVGGPRMGAGTGMPTGAQRKAPEPDIAAAAAAVATSAAARQRARQRRRAAMNDQHRGYRYEFLDSGAEARADGVPGPERPAAEPSTGSARGAGPLGFAGAARDVTGPAAEAAGLAARASGEFGRGPSIPMVPRTWQTDHPDGADDGR
ncbi:MAG: hypothetical protein WCI78_05625, partial [Mycobacterium sp.]